MSFVNLKFIDNGAFGNIYKVVKEDTNYKLELKEYSKNAELYLRKDDQNICIKTCSLDYGAKEYEYLKKLTHNSIVKVLFGYFDIDNNIYIIGMNLMHGNVVSFKQNINITNFIDQMMQGLQFIHDNNIVHCDIKPQNILYKKYSADIIYCISDFNIAYIYKNNHQHIKFKQNVDNKIIGTLNFCSLFCLLKCYPYRRDDIESLFITCLFIKNTELDEKLFTKETNDKILRKFRLCMYQYHTIQKVRLYKFYQDLDYETIRQLLHKDFKQIK